MAKFSVQIAPEYEDLTHLFDEKKLREISTRVIREYEIDEAAFGPRRRMIEEWYNIALQVVETKNYPFEGASNIKYPLLTKAALNFASMAFPAVVTGDRVVKAKPVGSDEGEDPLIGPDGKPMLDESGQPIRRGQGDKAKIADRVSEHMSAQILEEMDGWEDDTDRLLHILPIVGCAFKKTYREETNVSKLVLPQYLIVNSDARTMGSASRVTEVMDMYPHEIEEMQRGGIFRSFDYRSSSETLEGGDSHDESLPHIIIEQHRRLDLDDDGYEEPYIVWVHKETQEVCRIAARYGFDDIREEGGKVIKIKAQQYYTDFQFYPDPEGTIYGVGFGHLLHHITSAANTSINQLIDAGHRNVMGGGFLGQGMKIKGGTMKFRPGEWKFTQSTGFAIKDNMVPLPMPEPSVVLMALVEFLIRAGEDISAVSRVLSGDVPANMPATTALATIEQGLIPFKAVFKRIHRGFKKEFKRLFYLNQKYMTQEEYAAILDDSKADIERDYRGGYIDVVPVSDPDIVNNMQKIIRAQALMEHKDDPFVDPIAVRKKYFEALGFKDVDSLVKPPEGVNPMDQLQSELVTAQIKSQAAMDNRMAIETALNIEETQAKILKMVADATKALADAEKADDQVNLEYYKAQLEEIKERVNDARRVGPLAAQPGNNQVF